MYFMFWKCFVGKKILQRLRRKINSRNKFTGNLSYFPKHTRDFRYIHYFCRLLISNGQMYNKSAFLLIFLIILFLLFPFSGTSINRMNERILFFIILKYRWIEVSKDLLKYSLLFTSDKCNGIEYLINVQKKFGVGAVT